MQSPADRPGCSADPRTPAGDREPTAVAPSQDALRRRWRDLVERRLPTAAGDRDWPIHLDHCFARVLLDNAVGAPWRTQIAPPAWQNAPPDTLARAVALGEAALDGREDMATLNSRSLALRGKRRR